MSADHMVATVMANADALARVAHFLELFPHDGREAWVQTFHEYNVITKEEVALIAEYFGGVFAV